MRVTASRVAKQAQTSTRDDIDVTWDTDNSDIGYELSYESPAEEAEEEAYQEEVVDKVDEYVDETLEGVNESDAAMVAEAAKFNLKLEDYKKILTIINMLPEEKLKAFLSFKDSPRGITESQPFRMYLALNGLDSYSVDIFPLYNSPGLREVRKIFTKVFRELGVTYTYYGKNEPGAPSAFYVIGPAGMQDTISSLYDEYAKNYGRLVEEIEIKPFHAEHALYSQLDQLYDIAINKNLGE